MGSTNVSVTPFLTQLAELCRAERTRAKWVIVPTHTLGHTLGERLALGGAGWANVRFTTPLDLALPMANRNAQLLAVLVPGLELAIAQDDHARTLADDVRMALSESICGDRPAVDKVARSLGMSARALHRRRGELGTTYYDFLTTASGLSE